MNTRILVPASWAVVALAACSASTSTTPSAQPSSPMTRAATPSATISESGSGGFGTSDLYSNVQVGAVTTASGKSVVQVTVTNPESQPHEYEIELTAAGGAGGSDLGVAKVMVNPVGPGQSQVVTATFDQALPSDAKVRVTSVSRSSVG